MQTQCDLGIVMAGAVSAGAYTAGVIDFLLQALDEWQQARAAGDPTAPPHRINIRVIGGASAGGMTAAMLTGLLAGRAHRPIGNADPGLDVADNVLFQSWVNDIDIEPLLGRSDLEAGDAALVSLLDSGVLDAIAEHALRLGTAGTRKPYADERLEVLLTLGNLRGIPYNIPFAADANGAAAPDRPGHGLSQHRDYLHFGFSAGDGLHTLDWDMRHANWQLLRQGALATGAFPLGLAPRSIAQPGRFYDRRRFEAPGRGRLPDGGCECTIEQAIRPAWGGPAPGNYRFTSVDGGLFDNEPFELVRMRLNRGRAEAFEPANARRMLLAIDPFPDTRSYPDHGYDEPENLKSLLLALLGAMKNQGRFKPGELALAARSISASRRLIAPRRAGATDGQPRIASGLLGGFSGFLERGFRYHDFMLGRANCQAFLCEHFSLPPDNALINAWSDAQRDAHQAGDGLCPVIPLFGEARDEIIVPPWPKLDAARLDRLQKLARKRLNCMLPLLFKEIVPGGLARFLAVRLARWTQTRGWAADLRRLIQRQLEQADLYRE